MGTQGPFNEFIFTGTYSSVPSLANPPAVSSVLISDTVDHQGSWQSLVIVSASVFTSLSGSMGGGNTAKVFPTGTELRGVFTDIKLASGTVLALNEARR